jgi:hypothetical protein
VGGCICTSVRSCPQDPEVRSANGPTRNDRTQWGAEMTDFSDAQSAWNHSGASGALRKSKRSRPLRKIKEKYFRAPLEVRLQRSIMTVALTPKALKTFTISGPTFVAIGIVRWELEFGLLTIDPNGDYVRVNGSYKELLDPEDVRAAIFRASQNWNVPPDDKAEVDHGSFAFQGSSHQQRGAAFRLGSPGIPTAQKSQKHKQHSMFAASDGVFLATTTTYP